LSFTTPPEGQSIKKDPSTTLSGEKRQAVAKSSESSQPTRKKVKIGDDDNEDANIQDGTYDDDVDFIPITDKGTDIGDDIDERKRLEAKKIREDHRKAFMEKAFPQVPSQVPCNAQVQSAMMKSCRPKTKVDYIIYVLNHWEKGIEVKEMDPGPDRDRLVNFCREHRAGQSISISTSLRRFVFLANLNRATFSGSMKRMMIALGALWCQGRRSLMPSKTGITKQVTWVRRGLGSFADKSMPTSRRTL
jgi:hypothetical protein